VIFPYQRMSMMTMRNYFMAISIGTNWVEI